MSESKTALSLNEKILDIVYECYEDIYERDGNLKIEFQPAADEIEKLILQEKIDLLNDTITHAAWDGIEKTIIKIVEKINELTTELNKR